MARSSRSRARCLGVTAAVVSTLLLIGIAAPVGDAAGAFGGTGTGELLFSGPCPECPPAVLTDGARFTGGVSIGVNNGSGIAPFAANVAIDAGATVTSDNDNTLYASVLGGTGTFEVKT